VVLANSASFPLAVLTESSVCRYVCNRKKMNNSSTSDDSAMKFAT